MSLSVKNRMKFLRRRIKELAGERKELLDIQRGVRNELNRLKDGDLK